VPTLTSKLLREQTTIVCDRYAYSGVAFSSAKINESDQTPLLSMDWCKAPDRGLPAPDAVIFLDLTQEQAQERGG
jgi:dTMP kinase